MYLVFVGTSARNINNISLTYFFTSIKLKASITVAFKTPDILHFEMTDILTVTAFYRNNLIEAFSWRVLKFSCFFEFSLKKAKSRFP